MAKALGYVKRAQLDQIQKCMLCIISFTWNGQKSGGVGLWSACKWAQGFFLGGWEYSKIRLWWWLYNCNVTIIHSAVHLKVVNFKICNFYHKKTIKKKPSSLRLGCQFQFFIREDAADEAGQMGFISLAKRKSGGVVIERKSGSAQSSWDQSSLKR